LEKQQMDELNAVANDCEVMKQYYATIDKRHAAAPGVAAGVVAPGGNPPSVGEMRANAKHLDDQLKQVQLVSMHLDATLRDGGGSGPANDQTARAFAEATHRWLVSSLKLAEECKKLRALTISRIADTWSHDFARLTENAASASSGENSANPGRAREN
jgi:hypothetical protein